MSNRTKPSNCLAVSIIVLAMMCATVAGKIDVNSMAIGLLPAGGKIK
jgi:hypothetical protein